MKILREAIPVRGDTRDNARMPGPIYNKMNMEEPTINAHNKEEYPPMHTAEHILNATMVRMFGCHRSRNAHIERKKSKCDYELPDCPTEEQVDAIETKVNEVIARGLDITVEYMPREEASQIFFPLDLNVKCSD